MASRGWHPWGVKQRSRQAWTTVCSNATWRLFQRQRSKKSFLSVFTQQPLDPLPRPCQFHRWTGVNKEFCSCVKPPSSTRSDHTWRCVLRLSSLLSQSNCGITTFSWSSCVFASFQNERGACTFPQGWMQTFSNMVSHSSEHHRTVFSQAKIVIQKNLFPQVPRNWLIKIWRPKLLAKQTSARI